MHKQIKNWTQCIYRKHAAHIELVALIFATYKLIAHAARHFAPLGDLREANYIALAAGAIAGGAFGCSDAQPLLPDHDGNRITRSALRVVGAVLDGEKLAQRVEAAKSEQVLRERQKTFDEESKQKIGVLNKKLRFSGITESPGAMCRKLSAMKKIMVAHKNSVIAAGRRGSNSVKKETTPSKTSSPTKNR